MIIEIELNDSEVKLVKEWEEYLDDDESWKRPDCGKFGNIEHRMDEFCMKMRARLTVGVRHGGKI